MNSSRKVYNNGTAGGNNWPLKGGKEANWEGGIRVNALASGGFLPKQVRGKKIESLIGIWDWYATFCALAGVDPADAAAKAAGLPPVDSINMWPLLSGANSTGPRTEILLGVFLTNIVQGIIVNKHKLLIGNISMSGWQGPIYPNTTIWDGNNAIENCDSGCLFDIYADPTEHNNIAAANPTIVRDLLARIQEAQRTAFTPYRGVDDGAACTAAVNKYDGYWGPFLL